MARYFITGTDTDVGKTVVGAALLRHFNGKGLSTIGFKPIAAGCQLTGDGLVNDDALSLQHNSSIAVPYAVVNPYAYQPPIAPHIAATLVNQPITFEGLNGAYRQIKQLNADITLVEGAGGWCLPINEQQFLNQWVEQQQLDIIVVVGVKLGCLNHAFLTQQAIVAQGLKIAGWVANIIDPQTQCIEQNISCLKQQLKCPMLARIEFSQHPQQLEVDFAL